MIARVRKDFNFRNLLYSVFPIPNQRIVDRDLSIVKHIELDCILQPIYFQQQIFAPELKDCQIRLIDRV
jgi:hypothetical protein